MPKIYLVRHGRAAAGWDADADPGLDDLGHQQARATAAKLAPLGPLQLLTSPMARTRETAAPLAVAWGREPRIEERVSEIPSPTDDLNARGLWLREVAGKRWTQLDPTLRQWRQSLVEALLETTEDTIIFTHFIAINLLAGAARDDERVVNFRPDYCSITVLEHDGQRLTLVKEGAEAETRVL